MYSMAGPLCPIDYIQAITSMYSTGPSCCMGDTPCMVCLREAMIPWDVPHECPRLRNLSPLP